MKNPLSGDIRKEVSDFSAQLMSSNQLTSK